MLVKDVSYLSVEDFRNAFCLNKDYIEKAFIVNKDILVTIDTPSPMYPESTMSCYEFNSDDRNMANNYITCIMYDKDKTILSQVKSISEMYYKIEAKSKLMQLRSEYTQKINNLIISKK
ncbi:MAG: hypothetical protein IJH34_18265 [Romboutsia sp.]|nr:hypothetical protein [Romboutsia sp.]